MLSWLHVYLITAEFSAWDLAPGVCLKYFCCCFFLIDCFLIMFIIFLCVCMFVGVSFPFPLCQSQGPNPGCQTLWQALFTPEPSHWTLCYF